MSSITTAVPSGTGYEWCIDTLYADFHSTEITQCANASRGTTESDFETICCDGMIIDKSQNLYSGGHHPNRYVDLANLVCCRIEGPQMGGLQPILPDDGMTCTTGTPTPLASLAATNTANAQIYPLTFTSASGVSPNIGDFLFTSTPYCLWADTAHGIAMMEVTVPAATITTLPNGWPDATDPLISVSAPTTTFGVTRGSSGVATGDASLTSTSPSTQSTTSSTSSASDPRLSSLRCCLLLAATLSVFLASL